MLLLLHTALCFCAVKGFSLSTEEEEVCYGANFVLPFHLLPRPEEKIFFSPLKGGERKLIINNTMVDPRYKVTGNTVTVPDVTEKDEGTFLANAYGTVIYSSVTLKVKDCSDREYKNYGQLFTHRVPHRAEYIEFTPIHSSDDPVVLWNRTDPHINSGRRGIMQYNVWEMKKLTQADNGHYNVRRRDRSLIRRWKLTVEAYTENIEKMVHERLLITFALDPDVCTVIFQSETGGDPVMLMKSGALVQDYSIYPSQFSGRIRKLDSIVPTLGFEIDNLKTADSGIYEIRDQADNLALVVYVLVLEQASTFLYIGIAVGIILGLIFCCCCVKRCCCGKSSSKGGGAVPETADESAREHDVSQPILTSYSSSPRLPRYTYHPMNPSDSPVPASSSINPPDTQTAATCYSASPQAPYYTYNPANPINPSEPTSTWINPPAFSPADIRVSSQQPEVAPLGGQGAAPTVTLGSDNLSSTAEFRFELKGLPFPCAPPLNADSTFPNVYNSDKLNFR